MTDYLTLLASIDTIVADVLAANILDDDLSNYFSSQIYSEIVFPWMRDSEIFARLYQAVLPLTIFKSPMDEMVRKNPLRAHAMVTNILSDTILGAIPVPEDTPELSYSDGDLHKTILTYMEQVLLPKWEFLSEDMRAVYVFLIYGALNVVEGGDPRLGSEALQALLDLDNGNILYAPLEYRISEVTLPRLAVVIGDYLTPPPLSLVRRRVVERLLPYT